MPTTALFDNIAPSYDRLNRLMSFGQDTGWRRKAIELITDGLPHDAAVLDVATGTADIAIAIVQRHGGCRVVGVDLSDEMLKVGRAKVQRAGLDGRIHLQQADCLSLPFEDNSFDAVCVAFGMRNFDNLDLGLREMRRVLKPGGRLVALELSYPDGAVMQALYKLYALHAIPFVCGLLSGSREAYRYLPRSIMQFPKPPQLIPRMEDAGFASVSAQSLTFGVCRLYEATATTGV